MVLCVRRGGISEAFTLTGGIMSISRPIIAPSFPPLSPAGIVKRRSRDPALLPLMLERSCPSENTNPTDVGYLPVEWKVSRKHEIYNGGSNSRIIYLQQQPSPCGKPDRPRLPLKPGVTQHFSYVTTVPATWGIATTRVSFKYPTTGEIHTTEKAFSPGSGEQRTGLPDPCKGVYCR